MIYGYIRVSTDKQDTENQVFQIQNFCVANKISIDHWVKEIIGSRVDIEKRKLGPLLKKMKTGDLMIACELSRLGRNLMQIMSILHGCLMKDVQVWTIKDNYRLGNDISSKVLAFAFGLSAEIERNLISLRTREALARKKAEGMILGRPKGSKKKNPLLLKHADYIMKRHLAGARQVDIAKELKCHRHSIKKWISENIDNKQKDN